MRVHRTGRAADRDGSLTRVLGGFLMAVTAALQVALGTAAHASAAGAPDYGIAVEERFLATDVGGTLTVLPEVYTLRPDGSRACVPRGEPIGPGVAIEMYCRGTPRRPASTSVQAAARYGTSRTAIAMSAATGWPR
ncbi:hypothetical protein ACIRG4_06910 [Streptomyces sp. NPDC102395]|uniref:hypothetical protein n=1 Tax=Streptomyces sp. NPDC102395 TaxID=3366168 RepID=UPI0037FD496A